MVGSWWKACDDARCCSGGERGKVTAQVNPDIERRHNDAFAALERRQAEGRARAQVARRDRERRAKGRTGARAQRRRQHQRQEARARLRAARRLAEDGQYGVDAERRLRAKRRRTGSGAVEAGRSDNDTNSDASDDDAQQTEQGHGSMRSVLMGGAVGRMGAAAGGDAAAEGVAGNFRNKNFPIKRGHLS